MVQCEMCGASVSSPKTVKIEGAELDVCSDCADFGTEIKTQQSSSSSTKYSTGSSSSGSDGSGGSSGTSGSGGSSRSRSRSDMFDDMDEIVTDYDERIRSAREEKDLSQSDLANELNEKASLIRKLERGDTLPSDDIKSKLESFLGLSLTGGVASDDEEWSGGSADGEYTLGDVVKRKD